MGATERSILKRAKTQTAHEPSNVTHLLQQLRGLRQQMDSAIREGATHIEQCDPCYQDSARNLLAYLAMRCHDIRPLQLALADMGLSSLGRSEGSIVATLDAVISILHRLDGEPEPTASASGCTLAVGHEHLVAHANALFGSPPNGREVRIMVTLPSGSAHDYTLIHDLLASGMDCARINCAHDSPAEWAKMIEHIRNAEKELQRPCTVTMDLAGPKLRTGPIASGLAVVKAKPRRDARGRPTAPARVWLASNTRPFDPPSSADATFRVDGDWLANLVESEQISFRDARGAKRMLTIVECTRRGCWAELWKTAYFTPDQVLRTVRKRRKTRIASFPAPEQKIRLQEGETMLVTGPETIGHSATFDASGALLTPARIPCTLPTVFDDARAGEQIWFDDGKIGGVIQSVNDGQIHVRITHAPGGATLKSDKGINLPQTRLNAPALSPDDLEALAFAARHADVVEMSFVNVADDVETLLAALSRLKADDLGVVLKIETQRGFEHLPLLLLAGMKRRRFGVMIARGDLAVEGGFERMAELQEDILCVCEAAHVPVIWATQVLESLAKKGAPSRAEITDAATGIRAECVMLNKGPHVQKAVTTLSELLARMQQYHRKKRQMLGPLAIACQLADRPEHGG